MNSAVKAGVILAVAVSLVSVVYFMAGLHENPMLGIALVLVFIAVNIAVVVWALKQTARQNTYVQQLLNGAVIGLVGGVLILASSFVLQSYVFPDAMQETRDATVSFLEGMNMPEAQLQAQIAKLDEATPMTGAIQGGVGTLITSVLIAAIAGIFLRRK